MRSPNRRHDIDFLYKYASASSAIAVLSTQSMRWSSPLLFNDPFDVPREWDGFAFDELVDATTQRFSAYLRGEARPRSTAALNLLEILESQNAVLREGSVVTQMQFFMRLMREPMEKYLDDFHVAWREGVPDLRILCLSENPTSPAMWAHYAQLHTGVVLQFESSDERDSSWLLAQPVIYQTNKPTLPGASEWVRGLLHERELDWDEILREYHFVKHTDWSYEREHRVVTSKKQQEAGLYADWPFHPEDLRGVVLGARIDAHDEAKLRELVAAGYANATVYHAQIDYSNRCIVLVAT